MKDGKRFTLADGFLTDALKKVEIYPPSKPFIVGSPHILSDDNVGKFVAVNVKSFAHMLNIIWDEKKKDENAAIGVKYFVMVEFKILILLQKVKLLFVVVLLIVLR